MTQEDAMRYITSFVSFVLDKSVLRDKSACWGLEPFIFLSFSFSWGGIILPVSLFLFIAAHAIGQGSVIWVYISEIFPNHIRSSGQSFGTSTHWVLAALIPSMIPFLFSNIGASYVFLIFLLMMIFQLILEMN